MNEGRSESGRSPTRGAIPGALLDANGAVPTPLLPRRPCGCDRPPHVTLLKAEDLSHRTERFATVFEVQPCSSSTGNSFPRTSRWEQIALRPSLAAHLVTIRASQSPVPRPIRRKHG